MLYEVAIRTPLRRLFTYESDERLEQGMRVRVPFRSREMVGFVWGKTENKPKGLKKILSVCDEHPFFDEQTLRFYERAAQYYGISLGELLAGALPKKIQLGEKSLDLPLKPYISDLATLSEDQKKVEEEIWKDRNFKIHLLMGEMGSGKTEVYLSLIDKILKEGGQTLFLVPEISLTPQLEERLSQRLGGDVTVFHSQISEKKRFEAFSRALSGQSDVFLGARSALLLPFSNLKLIVVDEEHDSSYKQSERGPYHARDLAILRAQLFKIPIVLGSATPSLETYERARETKAPLYRLKPFYSFQKAQTKVVDLKEKWENKERSFITEDLHDAIARQLETNEQTLLFLNRRGSASQRLCVSCGAADECKNCSVTMTVHQDLNVAICHWCQYQKPLTKTCDQCGGSEFFMGGIGTKEVEIQIKARFPEARVARLDRDEAVKKNVLAKTIKDYSDGKIDILVGTQMISKGIDIPKLSLVGVILADQGWGIPDFRGNEKSFQLLRQLMGRGGRRGQSNQFIVQTFKPEHLLFEWLQSENPYESFAEPELAIRKMADLPPFSRLSLITLSHRDENALHLESNLFADRIRRFAESLDIKMMGPTPAPIARWKGLYRMHILVKASPKGHMTTFITAVLDDWDRNKITIKMKLDRDPYQLL
ncbi:MAG: primosomal replication factor [Bacteriovoracaceae bacterium]|nr:primosomal replication factor [Bacteriovoracaceae bacterium]